MKFWWSFDDLRRFLLWSTDNSLVVLQLSSGGPLMILRWSYNGPLMTPCRCSCGLLLMVPMLVLWDNPNLILTIDGPPMVFWWFFEYPMIVHWGSSNNPFLVQWSSTDEPLVALMYGDLINIQLSEYVIICQICTNGKIWAVPAVNQKVLKLDLCVNNMAFPNFTNWILPLPLMVSYGPLMNLWWCTDDPLMVF